MTERSRILDRQRRAAGALLVLACVGLAGIGAVATRGPKIVAGSPVVNINTADAADLQLLPGIGPAIAGRIVADREARGLYGAVDELGRVSGIGERTVRGLRDFATVGD